MTLTNNSIPSLFNEYLSDKIGRFWSRVDRTSDCWVYLGGRNLSGYGVFRFGNRALLAHRFSYEVEVGPIPEGLTLDHLCRNRGCVKPSHLDPVTSLENFLRGDTGAAARRLAARTHCRHGHPFDEANTYVWARTGHRQCRACWRARTARVRAEAKR